MSHRLTADDGVSGEIGLWLFTGAWFGVLATMGFLSRDAIVICPAIPGLLPLALAVRATRTRLRYGGAQFEMADSARVGGRLEGVLVLPVPTHADDRVRATLVCKRRRPAAAKGGDHVLWRGVAFGNPAEPRAQDRGRFPLSIEIPATCSHTGSDRAYWKLNVCAEEGLKALDVTFDVYVEGASAASG